MKNPNPQNIIEVTKLLNRITNLEIEIANYQERYQFIEETLINLKYYQLGKSDKGITRKYLMFMTKYSRAQLNLLISRYTKTGKIKREKSTRQKFTCKYENTDIILLAKTDQFHDYPNGCALKMILHREFNIYGNQEYKSLSQISVAHIYNMRKTVTYKRIAKTYQPTISKSNQIGQRRKPQPNGKPGYLRVDTVHQGDQDDEKGVYHINIIDEVVQFEFIGAVGRISEAYLIPLIEKLLDLFPFVIIEFHADNGSEYINHYIAELLNKLLIELSKNRSRKTNDNALIESKNGSIIRKWIGYEFIPKGAAKLLNNFYFGCFCEYLNYHRPCAFATTITDKKGKRKKIYKQEDYKTPYEKLKSLPDWEQYLKPDVTAKQLQNIAEQHSDTQMAAIVQQERNKLFKLINLSL